MNLESQVVSLELAKRLKELGVKQESLYGWSLTNSKLKHNEVVLTCAQAITHRLYNCHLQKETYISAFTVSELFELLPLQIKYEGEILELYCYYGKNRCYVSYVFEGEHIEIEEYAETEANARAKMLIHLLENGLIKND